MWSALPLAQHVQQGSIEFFMMVFLCTPAVQYKLIAMDGCEKLLNSYCSRVCSQFHRNEKLCKQFTEIRDVAVVIARDAHLYDFPGIQCNGFRFAVKTVITLMQLVSQKYQSHPDKDLIHLVAVIHCGLDYFKRLHEETSKLPLNKNGTRSLMFPEYDLVIESFQAFLDNNAMDVLCNSLSGFHLPKPDGPVLRLLFGYGVPLAQSPDLWSGLFSLFNYRSRRQAWRDAFTNFKVDYIKAIDFFADTYYTRRICPLIQTSFLYPNVCRDIYVPRQERVTISVDVAQGTADLIRSSSCSKYSSATVRCRLLMQTSLLRREMTKERPVVIHVHGGGFIIGSADNHEMYTRTWAKDLPLGTAFISIDYTLGPDKMFPEQLQQILDVFLWCNDSKFVETIGYTPNKFVLIGDSSGGVNLLALAVVLCDLEKKYPDIRFIYPSALVAVYPSFCVAPVALPSILLAGLHPELSPPAFLAMQSAYFPYTNNQRKIKYEKMTMSKVINWLTPAPVKCLLGVDGSTNYVDENESIWWNKSFKHSMERMLNWPLLRHPYASPLFYEDFERLGRMHLSLFPIESDPILDQSICLANKWQGSVTIKIIDDATHAFLPLADAGALDARDKYSKHRDDISRNLAQLVQGNNE